MTISSGKKCKHIIFTVLTLSIIVLASSFSGCVEFVKGLQESSMDPVLKRTQPYTDKILSENVSIRAYSASIVAGGPSGDKEYEINKAYRHVVENYAYYSDPRSREIIQTPFDTMQIKGGDCEDLTIFLCSILENLGIRTYFVITDDHTYCLASSIDSEKLWNYTSASLIEIAGKELASKEKMDSYVDEDGKLYLIDEKHEKFVLKDGYVWYYGGEGALFTPPIEYVNIEYSITSNEPVSLYVVPSKADYNSIREGKPYSSFPSNDMTDVLVTSGICEKMKTSGGIVIKNDARKDAIVDVSIKLYYCYSTKDILKNKSMTTFNLDNQTCVVLDATAGKFGYVGYGGNETSGDVVAIDPITKKYYYLYRSPNSTAKA